MDTALGELNARLKAGHHRCCVERRGASLHLRATLPEREEPTRRRQQRIALGLDADYSSLHEAERRAIELSHQLRTGSFSWASWDQPAGAITLTADDFRIAAERLHASKYRSSPERGQQAWTKKWAPALGKLPPSGAISVEVLVRVLNRMPPGTAGRRDQGNLLAQIAKAAGLDPEPVQIAARGYGASALQPRNIPTDPEIEAAWAKFRQPHWRWTWGMCAAFGLRPHEVIDLKWLPENWIRVGDATKTGSRQVTACPSAWIERFELRTLPRPTQSAHNLAKVFGDALERADISIKPYSLRHAYALRLMDNAVPPELGARLMGHSLQTHEATYKRWMEEHRITRSMASFNL